MNSLGGVRECSCGFLPGDLWEQEGGINGFAECFAVGIVLDRWCRACGDPELWGCRGWGSAAPVGSLCLRALPPCPVPCRTVPGREAGGEGQGAELLMAAPLSWGKLGQRGLAGCGLAQGAAPPRTLVKLLLLDCSKMVRAPKGFRQGPGEKPSAPAAGARAPPGHWLCVGDVCPVCTRSPAAPRLRSRSCARPWSLLGEAFQLSLSTILHPSSSPVATGWALPWRSCSPCSSPWPCPVPPLPALS